MEVGWRWGGGGVGWRGVGEGRGRGEGGRREGGRGEGAHIARIDENPAKPDRWKATSSTALRGGPGLGGRLGRATVAPSYHPRGRGSRLRHAAAARGPLAVLTRTLGPWPRPPASVLASAPGRLCRAAGGNTRGAPP